MMASSTQSAQSSSSSSTAPFPPPSTSQFNLGKLQAELECCICMCLYEEPKQLPCGHICCGPCVQSLIDMANEPAVVGILFQGQSPHKTIACPQCRKDCQVPADGFFPTAFTVQNLVSHVKEAELHSLATMKISFNCSACDKSVLSQEMFYCINCHDFDEEINKEEQQQELNARLMKKLICPLCGCKLHAGHKLVPAVAAYEAVKVAIRKKKIEQEEEKKANQRKCIEAAMENQQKSAEMEMPKLTGNEEKNQEDNNKKAVNLADHYRLKGNEAYARCVYEEAVKCYTLSIRQLPTSVCLSNRAQVNLKLGRYSLAYVDANEALRLDPNNKKAKMRLNTALEHMGMMAAQRQKESCSSKDAVDSTITTWAKDLDVSAMYLANERFVDDEEIATFMPQNMVCILSDGKEIRVPLRQLDKFLNQQDLQGALPQIIFKFFKFDDGVIDMFRCIDRRRFRRLHTDGIRFRGYQWLNCDFAKCSEAAFRWLLDELISTSTFCIAEWTGFPAGHNYNTLFKLKAFRDALEVQFDVGELNTPVPQFNMHLEADILIDFLHSPGFRSLHVIDGQLNAGFDSFLDRLIERFNQDQESRFYELVVFLLNPSSHLKRRFNRRPGGYLTMEHPKTSDKLILQLIDPSDMRIQIRGSYELKELCEFQAKRIRNLEDLNTIMLYHSQQDGGPMTYFNDVFDE